MTALIAMLMTLIQTGAIAASYLMGIEWLFADAVVYGSPFYMIVHAFGSHSVIYGPPLYLGYLAFHIIKYICIFHAKINSDLTQLVTTSVILEALYLCLSAYYLY